MALEAPTTLDTTVMESWSFTTTQEVSDVLAMIKLLLLSKAEMDTLQPQASDDNVLRRGWQHLMSRLKVRFEEKHSLA